MLNVAYASALGSLMYSMVCTTPDLTYAASLVNGISLILEKVIRSLLNGLSSILRVLQIVAYVIRCVQQRLKQN